MKSGSSLVLLCGWIESECRQELMSRKFVKVFPLCKVIFCLWA